MHFHYEARTPEGVRRRLALLLAIALFAGLAPGCSSGDDGGGGGSGMQTIPCIQLINTTLPAPETVVATDGSSGDCNLLYVDLLVSDVTDLFAVKFDLVYPASLVQFLSISDAGSVLTSGGVALTVLQNETTLGTVSIGITRLATSGVTVVGGQRLIRLTFFRLAAAGGSGSISFGNTQLLNSLTPPEEIRTTDGSNLSIPWFGGEIAIIQI